MKKHKKGVLNIVKVKLKVNILKEIDDDVFIELFENEIEVENTYKGVGAALLGWTSLHIAESQKIYEQSFGAELDDFNIKVIVSLMEDGVEVLNDGRGFYIHFYGQVKFVMNGIKGTNAILGEEVNKFIRKTYY